MHDIDTTRLESEPLSLRQEIEASEFEFLDAGELESPLSEVEEMELASELLAVSSEAELDQFLGDVFKKALKGIRKVGSSGLGGVLKGVAKKALPFVGGALGSIIPIPGVGTAVGTALGSAASKVIKAELEGLSPEDREFEMARRFVRFAGTAAKSAASTPPGATARTGIIAALRAALEQQRAQLADSRAGSGRNGEFGFEEIEELKERAAPLAAPTAGGRSRSGRWIRRGGKIILLGV
jgi:uncharacterized protein (DUF697 family)